MSRKVVTRAELIARVQAALDAIGACSSDHGGLEHVDTLVTMLMQLRDAAAISQQTRAMLDQVPYNVPGLRVAGVALAVDANEVLLTICARTAALALHIATQVEIPEEA